MSTRGALGFRLNGIDKVGYNHCDSYPTGIGWDAVCAVKGLSTKTLREAVERLRVVSDVAVPTKEDVEHLAKFTDLSVSECSSKDWYCLLRHAQGDVIATLEAGVVVDSTSFLGQSLFCEWAYIINLDTEEFEIYKGYQNRPHDKGRYAGLPGGDGYYAVALLQAIPFANLGEVTEDDLFKLERSE